MCMDTIQSTDINNSLFKIAYIPEQKFISLLKRTELKFIDCRFVSDSQQMITGIFKIVKMHKSVEM